MKIRGFLIILSTAFGVIALASLAFVAALLVQQHHLETELRAARSEWRTALQQEQSAAAARFQAETVSRTQGERLEKLEAELRSLKDAGTTNTTGVPGAVPAYRVRAYSNNRYLGSGWVVAAPGGRDPETGETRFEPVVVLDPGTAAPAPAKMAEPAASETKSTTINYNYPYATYPYYVAWPFWWPSTNQAHHPSPPGRFPQPPKRSTPDGQPFLSTHFFRPTEPPFLPPTPKGGGIVPHQAPAGPVRLNPMMPSPGAPVVRSIGPSANALLR